jgi:quercetin 2,3-dioxygenase
MITPRRAADRLHVRRHRQDAWLTFRAKDQADPFAGGFGALEILNEDRLPPGVGVLPYAQPEAEVVTYVLEGSLAQKDSAGAWAAIGAGEFQRMVAKHGVAHSAANASRVKWAHIFQIWLRHGLAKLEPGHEQRRFSAAQRRGALCVVASPDGRHESLRLHEDVVIFSAMLDEGQHLIHELGAMRSAWLHVVSGEVGLADLVLAAGDGVGFSAERSVSVTAREKTELLLFDLPETPLQATLPGGVA